jgi:TatD DNase family protein
MDESRYIDAHSHLSDDRVGTHAFEWIARARAVGVGMTLLGGTHASEWAVQEKLKQREPGFIRTSFGVHPWWVETSGSVELEAQFALLESCASRADAIGETGLDYSKKRDSSRFSLQQEYFRKHLELARSLGKPLVLHVVAAHAEALRMISEANPGVPMLVHAFSGSAEEAALWVKLGAFLSFGGVILREKGHQKAKKALLATPLSNLLFETDAPDQAWRPDHINEPALVVEVYQGAARLLGVPAAELQQIVRANFSKIR